MADPADHTTGATRGAKGGWDILWWLGPVLLVAALYAQVIGHGYIDYDDPLYTYDNPAIASGLRRDSIRWAWEGPHFANYHPLTWMSHMADFTLFGGAPGLSAAQNAAWHALNVFLVTWLLRRLFGSRLLAFGGGAVFACHPALVEAVAWISQRKTLLATACALAATHAWLNRREQRESGLSGNGWWTVSIVCYIASLLCKGMFVTLPGLLLLLDGVRAVERQRGAAGSAAGASPGFRLGEAAAGLWPFVILSLAWAAVTLWAQRAGGAVAALETLGMGDRIAVVARGYVTYLQHVVAPASLSMFYPLKRPELSGLLVDCGVLAAVTAAAAWAWRRRPGPSVLLGWLLFMVFLVPVIGLVQVGAQGLADRYLYPSMLGLLIALAALWQGTVRSLSESARRGVAAVAGAWLLAMALGGYHQVRAWQDDVVLADRSMAAVGRVPELLSLKARGLMAAGQVDAALALAREAHARNLAFPTARQNLAVLELMAGHPEEALAVAELDVAARPNSIPALVNLMVIASAQERWDRVRSASEMLERIEGGAGQATQRQRAIVERLRTQMVERAEPPP